MAVRLREADSMAAMAELRQKIADLEIQVCVCVCVCLYEKIMSADKIWIFFDEGDRKPKFYPVKCGFRRRKG